MLYYFRGWLQEDIDHTKIKAYSPQTNGIRERLHKTMKTECYDIMFRRKIYTEQEAIQQDIELWLEFYNQEKHIQGNTVMVRHLGKLG
ncbi:hypothetical protein BGI36_04180 [Snodgrassella communis]|nr:hypothetical protein BGI35_05605 [Snodgrassella communis]PIT22098.1 hypothetical protein BGI36_04180 [Snodgrassella communis]